MFSEIHGSHFFFKYCQIWITNDFMFSYFHVIIGCPSGKALHCTMPLRMMRGGIKSSLTWLISPREHMVLIMWRHCKFRSMQTVAWEGFTSLTASTLKRNSLQSSNCTFQCRLDFRDALIWKTSSFYVYLLL